MNRAQNSDHTERFVYPVVKIKGFLIFKGLWAFVNICAFQVLIGWAGKLQSHDLDML